jgi:polar amino acid transport system substrate-binding protein
MTDEKNAAADPRVAELARAGKVRVGLFPPQYRKDPEIGELRGVWVDLARAFATRVGVPLVIVEHATPVDAIACLRAGACDVLFLPSDFAEAGEFSNPILQFDYTMLVPPGSAIRSPADADRPGVRIAGVRNHASTNELRSQLKHAELVLADTPELTFELLRAGQADVMESIRSALLDFSTRLPGSRVLEDRFGRQMNRMVVPKGRAEWLAFVNEFTEQAKASGLVQQAIERGGMGSFSPAPAGDSR